MFCMEQGHFTIRMEENSLNVHRVVEHVSDHAMVFHWGLKMPLPMDDRDMVTLCVVKKEADGDCIFSAESTEHDLAPAGRPKGVVRVRVKRLLRFSPISPTVTRFTVTTVFDMCGSIPGFISTHITTPAAARAPLNALRYFNQIKPAEAFEAADGTELGLLLVQYMGGKLFTKVTGGLFVDDSVQRWKLTTFVDRSAALREARERYEWFEVLLFEILQNRSRVPKGPDKALADFEEEDARTAGRAFANALSANLLSRDSPAAAAVDEWLRAVPAIGELEQQ
jgi:hypothetical protein